MCYAIGVILDGVISKEADASRGARYNSALRYIELQKQKKKKTIQYVSWRRESYRATSPVRRGFAGHCLLLKAYFVLLKQKDDILSEKPEIN